MSRTTITPPYARTATSPIRLAVQLEAPLEALELLAHQPAQRQPAQPSLLALLFKGACYFALGAALPTVPVALLLLALIV